jgi:hypothetical protein
MYKIDTSRDKLHDFDLVSLTSWLTDFVCYVGDFSFVNRENDEHIIKSTNFFNALSMPV